MAKPVPTTKALYRVRKSWSDSKSQVGAYANLDNAISVAKDKDGYSVFDENGIVVYPKQKNISIGDVVLFKGNKHYPSSDATKGFVVMPGVAKVTSIYKNGKHPYHVIATDKKSNVYGWVDESDISIDESYTPDTIAVGSKVVVKKAVTYDGKKFVAYYPKYDVLQIKGDRVVIGIGKVITTAIHKDNISVV